MCNKKGCTTNNFPLKVIATKVEMYGEDSLMEYSKPLMQRLFEKLDMDALRATVDDLKWPDVQNIPDSKTIEEQNLYENEEFLMLLHDICCKRHITEGTLICNSCKREYPLKNGVVNMLLTEDEV